MQSGTEDTLVLFSKFKYIFSWQLIRVVKDALPEAKTDKAQLGYNFIAGAFGGTFGTMLNVIYLLFNPFNHSKTPFDVAKTRIQNQKSTPLKYGWTIPAVALIAKEEGFSALYKGFLPKVMRLGPGGGILLVVFEVVSGFIRKNVMVKEWINQ